MKMNKNSGIPNDNDSNSNSFDFPSCDNCEIDIDDSNKNDNLNEQNDEINKTQITSDHHFNLLLQVVNSHYSSLSSQNHFNSKYSYNCVQSDRSPLILIDPDGTKNLCNDNSTSFSLISSDNIFMNKVINLFTFLFVSIDSTANIESLYPLVVYGESVNDDNLVEGEAEAQISHFLSSLSLLYEKVKDLISLCINLINQIIAIYHKGSKYFEDFDKNISLEQPIMYIAKILSFFNLIDLIVEQNENLTSHWKLYRYLLSKCKDSYTQFGFQDANEYKSLEKKINKFNNSIMSGNLLESCIKNINESTGILGDDGSFIKSFEIVEYKNYLFEIINKKGDILFGEIDSLTETNEREELFKLYSLLPYLKKIISLSQYEIIYKKFYSYQTKINYIPLASNGIDFDVNDYMSKCFPNTNSKYKAQLIPKNPRKMALDNYNTLINEFSSITHHLRNQTMTFITRMGSTLFYFPKEIFEEQIINKLQTMIKIIINGIILAYQIKNLLQKTFTLLSINDEDNDIENLTPSLISCIESLKAIQSTFSDYLVKKSANFTEMIQRLLSLKINAFMEQIEKIISDKKNISSPESDVLAAINIINDNLKSGMDEKRIKNVDFSLDVINSYSEKKAKNAHDEVFFSWWQMKLLVNLKERISNVCRCDFIYWYRNIFDNFFSFFLDNHNLNISLICQCISNSDYLLNFISHVESTQEYIKDYQKKIIENFKINYLQKIAKEIENEIRYEVNKNNLNLEEMNIEMMEINKNFVFYKNKNFELFPGFLVDVKNYVKNYLDKFLYNLNVLNVSDGKIYRQMKLYAYLKYNIILQDHPLPYKLSSLNFDIIKFIQHPNDFAEQFFYDFHDEKLIEKISPERTMLNVISSNEIVESLKVHDLGIINTIINEIFKKISIQMKQLLTILLDDFVKSILLNEKYEIKKKVFGNYQIELAETFFEKNQKIVNKICDIVTKIGNYLSFVRLISTGVKLFSNKMKKCISTKKQLLINNFSLVSQSLSPQKINNFENILKNTNDILRETILSIDSKVNTKYLNVILKSFNSTFKNKKIAKDMELFYLIIPSITLCHLNRLIIGKEEIYKKNITDGYISNDGFIMGCVFLIKLFDIEKEIDSIHWFDYNEEKFDDDNNNEINKKKAEVFKKEFENICLTFDCAMILFNE